MTVTIANAINVKTLYNASGDLELRSKTNSVTSSSTFYIGGVVSASITSGRLIYGSTGSFTHVYGRTSIYTSSLRAYSITSAGRIYSNSISATGGAATSYFRSIYSNTGTFTNGLTVSGSKVITAGSFTITGNTLIIKI